MVLTIIVIVTLLVFLIFDLAPSDLTFGGALILLLLGGVINPSEVLASFSKKSMMTVELLFILR